MKIVEFRVRMPLTLEEYKIGQRYTVVEYSRQETGGGEGNFRVAKLSLELFYVSKYIFEVINPFLFV